MFSCWLLTGPHWPRAQTTPPPHSDLTALIGLRGCGCSWRDPRWAETQSKEETVWSKCCYELWCSLLRIPQLMLEVPSHISPSCLWSDRERERTAWMHYSLLSLLLISQELYTQQGNKGEINLARYELPSIPSAAERRLSFWDVMNMRSLCV